MEGPRHEKSPPIKSKMERYTMTLTYLRKQLITKSSSVMYWYETNH